MDKKKLQSSILLILTALIWGVAFVAQSVGMDYVGPLTFNAARFLIGGAVLIPCIVILRRIGGQAPQAMAPAETAARRKASVIGGLCCGLAICVASTLQQFGIMHTTVGKAGFITALYIVIVPLLGLLFGKRAGLNIWISVAAAIAGMYLLCITDGFSVGKGDFLVFLCAICFSVHIMVIDHFSQKADGVVMSCIQFFVAGIICAIPALLLEAPDLASLGKAWAPVLYAGVLSCGVAYTLQIIGQKHTPPTVASLILSLESVFSLLAGWIILNQALSGKELIGCVLVFAAIIQAQLPVKRNLTKNAGTNGQHCPSEKPDLSAR